MVEQAEVGRVTSFAFGGGRIEAFQIPGGSGVPLLVLGGVELGFRPLAGMEQVLQRRWERRAVHRPVTVLGRPIAVEGEETARLLNPPVIAEIVSGAIHHLGLAPPVGPVAIEAESGGGRISLWLTILHPDLVSRLVLASVASETPPGSQMATRMARWIELAEAQDWGRLFTGFAAHWSKNSNAAWAFDQWFLNLFPRESPFLYNAGGYATLSFIPTLGTMILGLIAGGWLRELCRRFNSRCPLA